QMARGARERAEAIDKHKEKFKSPTTPPKSSRSVAESWAGIEAWLAQNAPGYRFEVNPGASPGDIAAFEEAVGMKLPDDFKESLRIHDGGNCDCCNCSLPEYGDFLPLAQILHDWKTYRSWQEDGDYAPADWIPRDITGPIKPIFWNTKRIYITDNSG